MNKPLLIDYYSDVLCIWAWIAQRRIDELHTQLGDKIKLQYHYIDIFGDVKNKILSQWQDRGGYAGFAEHVQHSASAFEQAPVSDKLWRVVAPNSSANAHLLLKAIELAYDSASSAKMALAFRQAFFVEARDIGKFDVLFGLAQTAGLEQGKIQASINDGSAIASLMHDYQQARQQNIKGSPTYIINGGRQTLYGNVGYRVLQANIEEILKNPADEASWC